MMSVRINYDEVEVSVKLRRGLVLRVKSNHFTAQGTRNPADPSRYHQHGQCWEVSFGE